MYQANAYQSRGILDMTRIEMLLRLYAETIGSIETAQACRAAQDEAGCEAALQQARRFTLGLISGVNRDYQVGENQYRLLVFVMSCLDGDEQQWVSALHVLRTLESAFQEIEEESASLEKQGEVPGMTAAPIAMDLQV